MLELLQHRIRLARVERVTEEQQQREAVRERDTCGGDRVQRTRADGGGYRHDLTTLRGLRVRNSSKSHALLILPTQSGYLVFV